MVCFTIWICLFLLVSHIVHRISSTNLNFIFKIIACNLAGAIAVYFFLYESSNLSLESVYDACRIFSFSSSLMDNDVVVMVSRSSVRPAWIFKGHDK